MRRAIFTGFAGALAVLSGASVGAQNAFNGADIYIAGENPPLDNWNPGGTAALQLRNDGTNGDAAAGDNLWSLDYTLSGAPTGAPRFQFKAAHSGWGFSLPQNNAWGRFVDGSVKFVLDSTQRNDGFVPDVDGSVVKGIVYTVPSPVISGDTVRATGDFLSELGGGDWNNADNAGLMNDSGTSGDLTASDGVYTLVVTGIPAGSYQFKVTVNASWDLQVNTNGFAVDGGNFSFSTFATSDNIKIEFDSAKGRVRVSNDNPLANPGPPFFATSAAWDETLTATTQLHDDGTNGDITSGDGIHSRTFTTAASGQFAVQVRQYVGPNYPDSGGYPIDVATTGQLVLVQFDTNTYSDGYSPSTRYVWTDPQSRYVPSYVQPVGDFMSEFGGSDWNNNDSLFQMVDSGAEGDVVAGDRIYAKTLVAFTGVTNANWKGLGAQGSWQYQFGGPGEGFTVNGNNDHAQFTAAGGSSVTFQIDTATGRIGIGSALPVLPATRNEPAVRSASASDWQLFN